MIDENTKVNEDVKFDTYDGKDDSPVLNIDNHVVSPGSIGGNDLEKILIGHQYWDYNQEIWDTRVLGIVCGKLSPNPDGSGYVRQVIVPEGETIDEPEENVLYIYRNQKFKYLYAPITEPGTNNVIIPAGWVRVDNLPNLHLKDGGRETPIKENQKPRVRPQVFSNPVAFNEIVQTKGFNQAVIDADTGLEFLPSFKWYDAGAGNDMITILLKGVIRDTDANGDILAERKEEFNGLIIYTSNDNFCMIPAYRLNQPIYSIPGFNGSVISFYKEVTGFMVTTKAGNEIYFDGTVLQIYDALGGGWGIASGVSIKEKSNQPDKFVF